MDDKRPAQTGLGVTAARALAFVSQRGPFLSLPVVHALLHKTVCDFSAITVDRSAFLPAPRLIRFPGSVSALLGRDGGPDVCCAAVSSGTFITCLNTVQFVQVIRAVLCRFQQGTCCMESDADNGLQKAG